MFDLVVENASLVSPDEIIGADLAIRNGVIAGWFTPGTVLEARRRRSAGGLVLLPGLIDLHTHLREPGAEAKEDIATGTAAAAAGGFTTVALQPNTSPPVSTPAAFDAVVELASAKSLVDFMVCALATPGTLGELPALKARGAATFEVMMGDVPPEWRPKDHGELHGVLSAIAEVDGLAAVYSVDAGLVSSLERRLKAAGREDLAAFSESRPPVSEGMAVCATLSLVERLGGRVLLRQISTSRALDQVALAKRKGVRIWLEVNPHHLFLSLDEASGLRTKAKVIPPLRDRHDRDALWEALRSGLVDLMGTDHAPHELAAKVPSTGSIWDAAGGLPGLETALPLFLDAVSKGQARLQDIARLWSEQPARATGLFPRKGSLLPGADADFVLVDPSRKVTIDDSKLFSKSRWTPFAGREVQGRVAATYVRGAPVYEAGEVLASPGQGRLATSDG